MMPAGGSARHSSRHQSPRHDVPAPLPHGVPKPLRYPLGQTTRAAPSRPATRALDGAAECWGRPVSAKADRSLPKGS